jgi:hypothetical protein
VIFDISFNCVALIKISQVLEMFVDLQIFYSMASEMVSVVDIFQPMIKRRPKPRGLVSKRKT